MDTLLKTFSLGFLLRSIFASCMFIYYVSDGIQSESGRKMISNPETDGVVLNIQFASLLAGATVYGVHRAILYLMFIEW